MKLDPGWRDDKEQADKAEDNNGDGKSGSEFDSQSSPRAGNGLKSGFQRED
jgi:hypothetical protein